MVTPLTQRKSIIRQDKEAQADKRRRTDTGSGLILVSERTEKNATAKNEPSLSEGQQGAASPSDCKENKKNVPVCQVRTGPFCS